MQRSTRDAVVPGLRGLQLALAMFMLTTGAGCRPSQTSYRTPYATTYHALSPISIATTGVTRDNMYSVFESEMGRFSLVQLNAKSRVDAAGVGSASGTVESATIASDFLMYRTHPVEIVVSQEKFAGDDDSRGIRRGLIHVRSPEEYEKVSDAQKGQEYPPLRFSVPVYIGAGVRILADVSNISGDVTLASLPALGVAASAGKAEGEISVGTMGITGNSLGLLIQQPVSLNETSVQGALQAVGAIKASIAAVGSRPSSGTDATFHIRPVVMGFELAANKPAFVAAIRAYLYGNSYSLDVKEDANEVQTVVVSNTGRQVTDTPSLAALEKWVDAQRAFALTRPAAEREVIADLVDVTIEEWAPEFRFSGAATMPADPMGRINAYAEAIKQRREREKPPIDWG